jgi:hypothetical protein
MIRKFSILFALLLFATFNGFAQVDSTINNDSLNAILLKEYRIKLAKIDSQRTIDSVQKAILEQELLTLKTTDNLKKEELVKRLGELESVDADRLRESKIKIDSLRQTAKSYPVIGFFNDTLFLIYNKLGSFSAIDRAAAIENRIKKRVFCQ